MPQLMSMKDFLASGGDAVMKYKKTGILPLYVARPKKTPPPRSLGSKGSKLKQKKKKLIPIKKKVNNFYKSGGKVKK